MRDFAWALGELRQGKRVTRTGWHSPRFWIAVQMPQEHPAGEHPPTVPYLYLQTVERDLVPWVPSQIDLFAEDWEVANG